MKLNGDKKMLSRRAVVKWICQKMKLNEGKKIQITFSCI